MATSFIKLILSHYYIHADLTNLDSWKAFVVRSSGTFSFVQAFNFSALHQSQKRKVFKFSQFRPMIGQRFTIGPITLQDFRSCDQENNSFKDRALSIFLSFFIICRLEIKTCQFLLYFANRFN